jgi:hypothetical protein
MAIGRVFVLFLFSFMLSKRWIYLCFRCIICLALILTAGSCKKKAEISGSVVDFFTGQPLADVPIELLEHKFALTDISLSRGGRSWRTNTDGDGNFAFNIKAYRNRREYIVQVDPEFFPDTLASFQKIFRAFPAGQVSHAMDEDGGRGFRFTAAPSARAIIVLKRVTTDPIDKWENSFLVNGKSFYLNGTTAEPVGITTAVVPCDGKIVLKFTKISRGIETTQIDTLVVKPFELIRHRIFY